MRNHTPKQQPVAVQKTAKINYRQLREIYDAFGSVFFGYVRAMNIAHQGWQYEEALAVAKRKDEEPAEQNGVNYPYYLSVTPELVELKYASRSGSEFAVRHTNPKNSMYYDIEIEYPSTSSLTEFIDAVCADNE